MTRARGKGVTSSHWHLRVRQSPHRAHLMTLSFRIGAIPVRIRPSFFVGAAILYLMAGTPDPLRLALWTAIVLASVIAHELGHAVAGVGFGLHPSIELHSFGGTTSWAAAARPSPARRILISLAGPAMGFAVAALVKGLAVLLGAHGVLPSSGSASQLSAFVYGNLLFVNVYWGILNLVPMLPLDGGNVMAQALEMAIPRRAERTAHLVSLVVAGLAALFGLVTGQLWPAFLAVSFVGTNWNALKQVKAREHDAPMRATLEQAYAALDAKDAARVLALARPVALESQTAPVRAEALQLLAFGFLLEGRTAEADAAIAALPPSFAPHPSLLELRTSAGGAGRA